MNLPFYKKPLAYAIAASACAIFTPVHADELNDLIMLEEIVVTAQKREQNMQDTPISMQAFNAEALKKQSINDIADAAQHIPNVTAVATPGGSTGATIGIRGSVTINPAVTWEPTVGVYVDGVFVAKNMGGLFDVAELERIEVLRGPQGTLYGKNTIGGAVNLITRKPAEEFGGTVHAKVGNYNYSDVLFSVDTGKLGDVASLSFAINKKDRDGFYKNTVKNRPAKVAKRFGDEDVISGRVAALFDIADNLSLYYTYDISDKDNTPKFGQFDAKGARQDKRRNKGALDNAYYDKAKAQGHAVHITWNINDSLDFKSITAYRSMDFKDLNDFDGFDQTSNDPAINGNNYNVGKFEVYRNFTNKQYSQEFQLLGTSDIVDYVVGLYYMNEDTDAKNTFDIGIPIIVANEYGVNGESVALFGQADWKLTDALTLSTGLRWTRESKESYIQHNDGIFDAAVPDALTGQGRIRAKDHWQSVTPMVALSYLWDSGINTYVKVSQGWKSGGFNGEALTKAGFEDSYKPEKVTSYEVGLKSRWFENRLQANLAYFHNRITDMQVSDLSANAVYSTIRNAGKSVMQGVEMEFAMQISEHLTTNVGYSYLDAKYKKYNAGNYGYHISNTPEAVFPYAPRHNGNIGFEYKQSVGVGEVRARVDYTVTSAYSTFDNPANAAVTAVKRYGLLNARVALAEMEVGPKQSLEVGLWGKNLTNSQYRINGLPAADMSGAIVGGLNYYGDPRTWGADVTYKF